MKGTGSCSNRFEGAFDPDCPELGAFFVQARLARESL